jgi:ketosteroid isomerase-like protein
MRTNHMMLVLALAAIPFLQSCSEGEGCTVDQATVKAEIQALNDEFARGLNEKDIDAVMALYTDDANSYPPNKPGAIGKAAIRAEMESEENEGITLKFTTQEVWATCDHATELGTYVVTHNQAGQVASGRYMVLYKNVDGKWMLHRDMWSDEHPAPDRSSDTDTADAGEMSEGDTEAESGE